MTTVLPRPPVVPDGIALAARGLRKRFGVFAAGIAEKWAKDQDVRWMQVADEVRRQEAAE